MKAWKALAKIRTKTAEARETLDAKLTRAGEGIRSYEELQAIAPQFGIEETNEYQRLVN